MMKQHKLKSYLISSFITIFLCHNMMIGHAQNKKSDGSKVVYKPLLIGDKVPASILKKVPRKKSTRLFILDFWSTGCTNCMEAFPYMEQLQKQFLEELQIVLMNPFESQAEVEKRFFQKNDNRIKAGMKPFSMPTSLPAIIGNKVFERLFPAKSVPHHVWLDCNGKVLHITYGYNSCKENIQSLLRGEKVNMTVKDDIMGRKLLETGYLQSRVAEVQTYYSVFIPFFSVSGASSQHIDSIKKTFRISFYNIDPISFLADAFRSNDITLRIKQELENKEQYRRPDELLQGHLIDDWSRKYLFSYELQLPLDDRFRWKEKMQQDVNYFLGNRFGIEGLVENRKFKSLVLSKNDETLLQTSKGPEEKIRFNDSLLSINNYPFSELVNILRGKLEDMDSDRPFLDETKIEPEKKIDIQLKGDLKNLENVKEQLKKYGLDIITSEREVKVLIIRNKIKS